jgi:hypothetical protein
MIIRYVAVVQIEQYVKSSFSSSELLNLIEFKKASIWGKFFIPFKAKKNHGPKAKEEGTFGVPLDMLTERTGVESNLGSGHSPLKLASFIDDAITAMRQMDMTVEGVFRKNGNIRRLKELADALDRNANDVDLTQENAIQVAALLKKFLRDLPDPLLTHRLHPLFMCAESKLACRVDRAQHILTHGICRNRKPGRETPRIAFGMLHVTQMQPRDHGSAVCVLSLGGLFFACHWRRRQPHGHPQLGPRHCTQHSDSQLQRPSQGRLVCVDPRGGGAAGIARRVLLGK